MYRYKYSVIIKIGTGYKNTDKESLSSDANNYHEANPDENEELITGDQAKDNEGGNDVLNTLGNEGGFDDRPWKVEYQDENNISQYSCDDKGAAIQKAPEMPQKNIGDHRKSCNTVNKPNTYLNVSNCLS